VGSQYLIHDDANQNPKVPAYAVLNLHTSYQLTPNVELFGLVNNALNQHYYAQGTFFDIGNQPGSLGLTDPRSFSQGKAFAAFGGVRADF
jgi:iron complex outermembrane recepter protein